MATFNIDIKKYILPYLDTIKNIIKESCDTSTTNYPIGITDSSIGATPSIIFLVSNYTTPAKKTLHIKNIIYKTDGVVTAGNDFSIEYLSTKLSGVGTTSIDVTSLVDGTAITGLELISNVIYGEVSNKTITFDYVIESVDSVIGEYTTTTISLSLLRCTSVTDPIITNSSSIVGDHDCGTYNPTSHYVTITLQEGENLKLKIRNTVRGLGTFNGFIRRLSVCCQDPSVGIDPYDVVAGFSPSNTDINLIYNPIVPSSTAIVPPWNVIHLQIFLCMLRMYGDNASLANTHQVQIDVLNKLDVVVHTITLDESRPGI